jgi:ribokinase
MSRLWPAIVYGPAYLDRVLRVDAPLLAPDLGGPIDQSMDGALERQDEEPRIELHDDFGLAFVIKTPASWPGPFGIIRLTGTLLPRDVRPSLRSLEGISWHDDLGGMGAGFAAALGGTLVSALGDTEDLTSKTIESHVRKHGISHRPIRVAGRAADWTLLLTSGPHGDKLAIGFRGCHAAVESFVSDHDARLIVVAGLPIARCEAVLPPPSDPKSVRLYAPSLKSISDPIDHGWIILADVLCCNLHEWNSLHQDFRARLQEMVPLIAVTDGPRGVHIRGGGRHRNRFAFDIPAFPRAQPPRDTNRAGEAFAATLVGTLLNGGWQPRVIRPTDELRRAAIRASAAAALVLDMEQFGFPTDAEIDAAVARGIVDGSRPCASGKEGPVQ